MINLRAALTIAAVLSGGVTVAQESQPPAPTPAPAPQPPVQPPTQEQPSLDELLGLPKAPAKGNDKPRPDAADPTRTELDRKLSAGEMAEAFRQAVDLMGETAGRIQDSKDTGLTTQRLQEDIVRKLEQLIKAAEQNQSQSRRSRSQAQRDQQQQQPNQQQAQGQRNQAGSEPAQDVIDPPPRQDAVLAPGAGARGAAWGALPERIRDALRQGNDDRYSSLWHKWTEAYYKRLAEDASK